MLNQITRPAAWAALAVIVLVALFPSGTFLEYRSNFADRALRYGVLAFFLVAAYPKSALATALLIGFGTILLEAMQLFIPGKSVSLSHLIANIAGASLGVILAYMILFALEQRNQRQ